MKRLLLILSIFATGCGAIAPLPRWRVVKQFDCYTGEKTDIEKLIDIDGYFLLADGSYLFDNNTKLLFFDDGIFRKVWEVDREDEKQNGISDYLGNIVSEPESQLTKNFYEHAGWGPYYIEGDTIRLQCTSNYGAYSTAVYEEWYKIIDRHTLLPIKAFCKRRPWSRYDNEYIRRDMENPAPATFIHLDVIPQSSDRCWLKEEKRFWCK